MVRIANKNKQLVRIIIGKTERGKTGVQAPMRSILLEDAETEDIYKKLVEVFK